MSRLALFLYVVLMGYTASVGIRFFIVHFEVTAQKVGLVAQ